MTLFRRALALVWRNKWTTALLLVVAYLLLQRMGYLLSAPDVSPGDPTARAPFSVDFDLPDLNSLYRDYREKGLEILAISSDVEGKRVVAPYVEKMGLKFPILLDPRGVVGSRLRVRGIPTSYLLDKRGRVAGVEVGARDWNRRKVRRFLDRLLAEEGT
ncbi:MAG: TlpA disulfide reductase family protein [Nitrospinota bacterium]